MSYISALEAAKEWKITQTKVSVLCKEGLINGATIVGNTWVIPADAVKPHSSFKQSQQGPTPRPFLKWAGGKGQLLKELRKRYAVAFKHGVKKYAEPFVGSGALLFDILATCNFERVFISDINYELINTYKVVRKHVNELIEGLSIMQELYLSLDTVNRKKMYYEARNEFNIIKANRNVSDSVRMAVLMIFLNKTCFNGLYRVNRKGLFNVPTGDYKKPLICDPPNLLATSKALKDVEIVHGQFTDSVNFVDEDTLVYFDPPYRPLNSTSSFTSYTDSVFNDKQQISLAKYVDELTSRGSKIIISNSDPKSANPDDNFFDDLYSNYTIERVRATRAINSKASARGKINELLITNF